MRLLQRQRPGIDEQVIEMFALIAPGSGPRPSLDDEVVRFLEQLAVVGRIGVIEELLAAGAAHPSGHQPPARDHVDFGQLLRHPQRILDDRQRIADQYDAHLFGDARQDRRLHVHHAAHAKRRAVMLVEGDRIESQLLRVAILVQIVVVVLRTFLRIKEAVGDAEERLIAKRLLLRDVAIRSFGEISDLHSSLLFGLTQPGSF